MVRERRIPEWLSHAVAWQGGPVPWGAVVRGGLGAGVALAAGAAFGHPTAGVLAALGALLAGVNDRSGSRRSAIPRLGLPALAGALGMLIGTPLAAATFAGAPVTLALTALALPVGALSAAGPVASAASTQLLMAAVIAAGMPLPEPAWQRALFYLVGGLWLLTLRLLLPSPGRTRPDFLDGEREAVAGAYDAVADLLLAAGGPTALDHRARLTAALDRAQDALAGPRLRRGALPASEQRLRDRFAAVLPLAEAATALARTERPVAERVAEGPRRLAQAVRDADLPGALPAPLRGSPALRALDDALLNAARTFARTPPRQASVRTSLAARPALRRVTGPAGREYGLRVAIAAGTSAAVAQALHPHHWYWLPVTAVFLVKPDLGPLASRAINRALGTVAGALLFAGLAAVAAHAPGTPDWAWPYPLAVVCGALVPVAMRHFALQTGVVTILVLAFVTVGGDSGAYLNRVTDTLLACAIVLLVGHLPLPVRGGGDVSARLSEAGAATARYARHVLERPGDTDRRFALRRTAYRTLAGARTAAELAAAELPPLARHSAGAAREVAALERLADTATATAVHLDHPGDTDPAAARAELLRLATAAERSGRRESGRREAAPPAA